MKRKLEIAHVETPVVKWMDDRRILHRKGNVGGSNGWPDRDIFLPNGKLFMIEFKRPRGEPEPLQENRIVTLRLLGHDVEVFDDPKAAIAAIRERFKRAKNAS